MKFNVTLATALVSTALSMSITAPLLADEYTTNKDKWYAMGVAELQERLAQVQNTGRAKNIILFIADGMSIANVTAGRIFDGQSRGEEGEENFLSFERFPYLALVKTYSSNAQVPDSAATASAMNSGVKTRSGVINVPSHVPVGSCEAAQQGHPATLAELARVDGKAIGIISTSLITDATPAAVYAHSPSRGWMFDAQIPEEESAFGCLDIATQLLNFGPEVALGGGRMAFFPDSFSDPEDDTRTGLRADERDLSVEWMARYEKASYVWNLEQFNQLEIENTDHLLGLFRWSTMQYEADRPSDPAGEPSLAQMTATAIQILERDDDGFYLMVESGRVDHANHGGNAYRALIDTQAFSEAVAVAARMVDLSETLIIVTADHSHVMSISGYPAKGNPILGLVQGVDEQGNPTHTPSLAEDGKPYTTLGYYNGPGAIDDGIEGGRPDLSMVDTSDRNFRQQAVVPTASETHGGDDVSLYAIGPWAHLFSGVMEQNTIFHIMKYAMDPVANMAVSDAGR